MVACTTHISMYCRRSALFRSTLVAIACRCLFFAVPAAANDPSWRFDPFEPASVDAHDAEKTLGSPISTTIDPFEMEPSVYDPFVSTMPVNAAAYSSASPTAAPRSEFVFLQTPSSEANASRRADAPSAPATQSDVQPQTTSDPCAGGSEKPIDELGINIVLPSGLLPKDHAALCWAERNAMGGPFAGMRFWPMLSYFWVAPCVCYRPLYFEEINLERHGYGCCKCIQPAVSAAHFFGTIPCLPYCMAEHCPCQCEYTLGHYRPGSCPPWRFQWPSCKPIAAATEAGVVTGLIFAIP
jgi:hypothetical protein